MSRFDRDQLFNRASFADIAQALSDQVGGDWAPFVDEWDQRTGAPSLEIIDVEVTETLLRLPGRSP